MHKQRRKLIVNITNVRRSIIDVEKYPLDDRLFSEVFVGILRGIDYNFKDKITARYAKKIEAAVKIVKGKELSFLNDTGIPLSYYNPVINSYNTKRLKKIYVLVLTLEDY